MAHALTPQGTPGDPNMKGNCDDHSQWTHFMKKKKFMGQKKLKDAFAKSNDFWNLYEHDILLAKGLGATSFRFSFEWARFEPLQPGVIDPAAVERYHAIIDCIISHGMEPMSTLHHFTHPQWFEATGGFKTDAGIAPYLGYVQAVFLEFKSKVRFWATFNEPTCFSFVGYIMGFWAPGERLGFARCGEVLLVLLKAHVAAYKLIKSLEGGQHALVGLVHQHIHFQSKTDLAHTNLLCSWMTYFFAAEVILRFFKTGEFEWKVPFKGVSLRYSEPNAPSTLDWWGINYYSSPCIDWAFRLGPSFDKEPVSDIDFRCYPQGLYDAIVEASDLGVPIFITETGVADKKDRFRGTYIRSHYSAVLRAIKDGYDVRGIFFWTLMDNIEWHEGFHVKYGLYEWDPVSQRTKGLRLRLGGEVLRDEIHAVWPDDLAALHEYALKQPSLSTTIVIPAIPTHNTVGDTPLSPLLSAPATDTTHQHDRRPATSPSSLPTQQQQQQQQNTTSTSNPSRPASRPASGVEPAALPPLPESPEMLSSSRERRASSLDPTSDDQPAASRLTQAGAPPGSASSTAANLSGTRRCTVGNASEAAGLLNSHGQSSHSANPLFDGPGPGNGKGKEVPGNAQGSSAPHPLV